MIQATCTVFIFASNFRFLRLHRIFRLKHNPNAPRYSWGMTSNVEFNFLSSTNCNRECTCIFTTFQLRLASDIQSSLLGARKWFVWRAVGGVHLAASSGGACIDVLCDLVKVEMLYFTLYSDWKLHCRAVVGHERRNTQRQPTKYLHRR